MPDACAIAILSELGSNNIQGHSATSDIRSQIETSSRPTPTQRKAMRVLHFAAFALPLLVSASLNEQSVFLPPSTIPPEQSMTTPDYTPLTHTRPTLADLLTIEPSASIYYSYARDTELSKEFNAADQYLTLLVPTNKAVMAQPRKP